MWRGPCVCGALQSFGFHHTATEVWYNEFETKYKVCNGSGEDPSYVVGECIMVLDCSFPHRLALFPQLRRQRAVPLQHRRPRHLRA